MICNFGWDRTLEPLGVEYGPVHPSLGPDGSSVVSVHTLTEHPTGKSASKSMKPLPYSSDVKIIASAYLMPFGTLGCSWSIGILSQLRGPLPLDTMPYRDRCAKGCAPQAVSYDSINPIKPNFSANDAIGQYLDSQTGQYELRLGLRVAWKDNNALRRRFLNHSMEHELPNAPINTVI